MASAVADQAVQVNTVRGPVSVDELGMTLTHEHLIFDFTKRFTPPEGAAERKLYGTPVGPSMNWLLADRPFCCFDNGCQDDPLATAAELGNFSEAGGRTVVDCTNGDFGRDPLALKEISDRSGINVVMGSGWYVHGFHDSRTTSASADQLTEELLAEFTDGVGDTGLAPGVIGEIGVSPDFTDAEKIRLRAASRAQRQLGVPLMIHLPGWQRRAFEVLDIVLGEEGVTPAAVVMCHMDPSGHDVEYQRAVSDHGVWLEFDMIGMPFYYPGEGQSPAPDQTAAAVAGLIRDGYSARILLSHDVAAKSMLTCNGGNGFGYVPKIFLPRLERYGVTPEVAAALLTANPGRLFAASRT
ncbi:phosphotriesterase [Pseudonocardia sp. KRD-184]|uniref:Phosphotriesterase n=1 Tax=Pseudonocardia oceani TaxID=2792013 RepID=A0ABS6U8B2_9PSEU|nr:phosphotriesterase [Pseudonocardia oceani]MBW0095370.1 phosphotriesterase [Pseudonocardia oceani]MBW0108513.1 phosphotriesterase [Pseudonocardia oceani]MBW0121809.1 phosphotriesterase [Pseudonocardia oceani]MBW0128470.1 phosphotriesterase [Pseudonocardia oceani]